MVMCLDHWGFLLLEMMGCQGFPTGFTDAQLVRYTLKPASIAGNSQRLRRASQVAP